MTILEIFLLAVALSMDAFAVAVASGCSVRTVSLRQYLRVGGAFGLFQCLSDFFRFVCAAGSQRADDHDECRG